MSGAPIVFVVPLGGSDGLVLSDVYIIRQYVDCLGSGIDSYFRIVGVCPSVECEIAGIGGDALCKEECALVVDGIETIMCPGAIICNSLGSVGTSNKIYCICVAAIGFAGFACKKYGIFVLAS